MFTGLVQAIGTADHAHSDQNGILRLGINAATWDHRPRKGDSISVDGCCLTVIANPVNNLLLFDVIPQTRALTTLSSVKPGQRLNLEHAATPTTLLGGHVVQGHVDGVGVVTDIQTGGDYRITIKVPGTVQPYVFVRGSVSISGVSLTLADVAHDGGEITVALIPTTLALTNLGELRVGQSVNLEADATTKSVVQTIQRVMEGKR